MAQQHTDIEQVQQHAGVTNGIKAGAQLNKRPAVVACMCTHTYAACICTQLLASLCRFVLANSELLLNVGAKAHGMHAVAD
jgi:hypothetical protein